MAARDNDGSGVGAIEGNNVVILLRLLDVPGPVQ